VVTQAPGQSLAQERAICPHGGRTLAARGAVRRSVETLVGAVIRERPYCYGVPWQVGFSPLDEALERLPQRQPGEMQKAAARLAADVPYATAAEWFPALTGLALSDHTRHRVVDKLTAGVTVLDARPTAAEVRRKVAPVAAGQGWRPIVVLAIEGAAAPTRPETAQGRRPGRRHQRAKRARWTGEWREAKGFRFSLVAGGRIVHVLSWPQVQTDDELAVALQQVTGAELIPEDQVRWCVMADGAPWLWKQVQALCPSAVEMLDD
jgi:hypothetical protein